MLATGIKTPVGIKIGGPDLQIIQGIGQQLEQVLKDVQGTASVYAERVVGGRYINIDIDRLAAACYQLNIADIQGLIASAVGGVNVTSSVEGLERYPIQIRFPQAYRDSPEASERLPITTKSRAYLALGDIAKISIIEGPAGIKSENARPNGWVYIDIENIDIGQYVDKAMQVVNEQVCLPVGYALTWSGQYEYMQRANAKLTYVIPLTLSIIIILLYLNFRSLPQVIMIIGTLPFALIGGIWLMYLQGFNYSIAVGVGFIALAGVAEEIGIIMLTYLDTKYQDMAAKHSNSDHIQLADLKQAIATASLMRIRPVMMTSTSIIFGLLPVMLGTGTGSEVMSRIAAPMVGGMVSALILTLIVLPAMYLLWRKALIQSST